MGGKDKRGAVEAASGVEPLMEVLQTSALPLGYAAVKASWPAWNTPVTCDVGVRRHELRWFDVPPSDTTGAGEGARTLDLLHGKQTL